MPHRNLLIAQLFAAGATITLHLAGSYAGLYDSNAWFDEIVHLVGGLWVGLSVLWTIRRLGAPVPERAVWIIAATLAIGIAWELFELAVKVPQEGGYALDTACDLAADLMGGFLAFRFARRAPVDASREGAYGETDASEIHELPRIPA